MIGWSTTSFGWVMVRLLMVDPKQLATEANDKSRLVHVAFRWHDIVNDIPYARIEDDIPDAYDPIDAFVEGEGPFDQNYNESFVKTYEGRWRGVVSWLYRVFQTLFYFEVISIKIW